MRPAKSTFAVGGMTCAACQSFVQRTLAAQPGVLSAAVNLLLHSASVDYDPSLTSPSELAAAVRSTGYEADLPLIEPAPIEEQRQFDQEQGQEYRRLRRQAAVSLSLAALAMVGMLDPHAMHRWEWAWAALTCLLLLWSGRRIFVKAWSALRHGSADMNVLVALGVSASLLGRFYESALFIVGFVLLGHALEARAKVSTTAALRALAALQAPVARVERGGREVDLPLEELLPGDVILVRAGERLPADGVVVEGSSSVDESMLSGESVPRQKKPGDLLTGGTLNQNGFLRYRATGLGAESTLSRIIRLLRQAQLSQAPAQRLADRVSAVFVPVVVVLALLAFWASGRVENLIAVLVVACPCAMGLAVPTALMVACGRAARLGALVKDAAALERLAGVGRIVFDKTGTLTTGRLLVQQSGGGNEELQLAASVEAGSNDPYAVSLLAAARQRGLSLLPVTDFAAEPGWGVRGTVQQQSVEVGGRPTTLRVGGVQKASFAFSDELRPGVGAVLGRLREQGQKLYLLSGDEGGKVSAAAALLGISEFQAEVSPEDKVGVVRRLQADGERLAMVGDGINDAAALATADVGLAMSSGMGVSLEAAHITILRDDLAVLPDLLDLARRTTGIVRQNLFWAFAYNVVAIPVAAGLIPGWSLNPALAAALMSLSSVSVLANSLRLR